MTKSKMVVVGCSAGGVSAIQNLLEKLPTEFQLPLVVIQHIPADADFDLNLVFGRSTRRSIFEVTDKMLAEMDCVYFAPPGYHLLIEKDLSFSLSQDEPVNYARPSIDVCFESAAVALGDQVCGVLLTGANSDGALGLQEIQNGGGLTLVQNPEEATSPTMPNSALQLFKPHFVGTIDQLSVVLTEISKGLFP